MKTISKAIPLNVAAAVLLLVFTPIALFVFCADWRWANEPVHSAAEAAGAVIALSMAYLLLYHSDGTEWSRNGIMLGFICLGVADALHATTRPGQDFVFLHNIAVLTGGIGFALSWSSPCDKSFRCKRRAAIATLIFVAALGLFVLLFGAMLPRMVENGSFTLLASAMNIVGGLLFLAAAWRFVMLYHRLGSQELLGFAFVAVLLGLGGLTFSFSEIWSATWWFWHLLRLSAYIIVLWLLIQAYRQAEMQKDRQREALKVANAELIANREELRRIASELERSNTELEQFAYIASHDLQAPLRSVTGFLDLLSRRYKGQLGAEADEFISFAVKGAERMHQLINEILAFSRVGTRGGPLELVNSRESLDEALGNLKIEIEESVAQITVNELPIVTADRHQLVLLFQNLVGNAVKYHKQDQSPCIHVDAEEKEDEWEFLVRDKGIGIDRRYAKRIFEIFQRLHTIKEYPGTGIGLAICKKIVERHGGRIWVESEPGEGSTFFFTLPKS
jgi:signal transduction histidine kinase